MKLFAPTAIDGYKVDHRRQYPKGTEIIFSNGTPRGTRRSGVSRVVYFGMQYAIKEFLVDCWNKSFFEKDKEEVVKEFNRRINNYLGPNSVGDQHIRDLHDLGYLPVSIWSLPEGTVYDLRVPAFVIYNTDPKFFWVTNYLETIISCYFWGMCTSATTAHEYKKILKQYAQETVGDTSFVQWQGHNFSFRGMFGPEAACMSDAGHLLSFTGTDTIPGIFDFLEPYYNCNSDDGLIGGSVAATEHSVMCANGEENEYETFLRLITEIYPTGVVSIVSDTWDYWNTLTNTTVRLKDVIMAREGKTVFRPDSGDPVKIVVGDPDALIGTPESKGSIQVLWDIFGGTISPQGYKVLDPHVGLIYGDSITIERAMAICEGLKRKGFASTNIVFGIGSFTYQYVTRDTDQYAIKATFARINGVDREISKNPKTDNGMKKSAKGLCAVFKDEGQKFYLKDQATWDMVHNCEYVNVFHNGEIMKEFTLSEIRETLSKYE